MKKLTMKDILDKYKDANMFSLTGIENSPITDKEREEALVLAKKELSKYLMDSYNKYKDEYSLPSFDILWDNIVNEVDDYGKSHADTIKSDDVYKERLAFLDSLKDFQKGAKDGSIKDAKGLDLMDDVIKEYESMLGSKEETTDVVNYNYDEILKVVGKETKYSNPKDFFVDFYSYVGDYLLYRDAAYSYESNGDLLKLDDVLEKNLIRKEISFSNEANLREFMMCNYYFKLNDETKKWLLKFDNDFELYKYDKDTFMGEAVEGLEDLTLYKDSKVLFVSNSHERYNSLEKLPDYDN